jgi:hypothetical protein
MSYAVLDRSEPGRRLRDAEALLKIAAGLGRLGAWSLRFDDLMLTWSDEVCAIHEVAPGYRCTVEEAFAFYLPQDRPALRDAVDACAAQGRPFSLDLRLVTARGRTVWVRAIGEAERTPDGAIVGVQGAFQDISQQKEAAEENRRLLERLTMTLESMTEAFFTLDCNWRFTYLNSEADRVVRRRRGELLGKVLWDEFPAAIGTMFHQQYMRAMARGTMAEFEAHYPPLDIWLQVRAYPSSQGLAVSFRDITERRRTQQELLRLNAELEQRVLLRTAELQGANRDLEEFAHSIAHDLRAPMHAINGFARTLAETDGPRLSERGRSYLHRVRSAGLQLEEMTDGLLALSRLAAAAVHRRAVDLGDMAADLIGRRREAEPGRVVAFATCGDLGVQADRVLVKQVLENLLGNAWKFTRDAQPARIELGVQEGAGAERVFFVRDNGAGFDMAFAQRLFQPFCRLHTEAEFEGTGIGLTTVQKIVHRHGGRIWAEAAPDRGATFAFTLGEPS